MEVAIYNAVFLRRDAQPMVNIGGIETLISYLLPVLDSLGWTTHVFQSADADFDLKYQGARVHGFRFADGTPVEAMLQSFRQHARSAMRTPSFVEIFGADHFSIKTENPWAISIQNGVWWDQPIAALTPRKIFHTRVGELVFRLRKQFQMLRLFDNCPNHVCVDHNFINWYRTCRGETRGSIWVNPNPAPLVPWNPQRESHRGPLRIIFARRLVPQKGTRLITAVFKKLLAMRPDVVLTFAGEGPEESFLKAEFGQQPNVRFTRYEIRDVMDVLAAQDVSVIPSLLSEGTCLSVVEAMASGCAVVATNFGGMTNQIIDGYNGRLVLPKEEELLAALVELADFPDKRLAMQRRGWELAQTSFSLQQWRSRWEAILHEVVSRGPAA